MSFVYENEDEVGYYLDPLHDCPYCGRWDGHRLTCPARPRSQFEEGVFEECPWCHTEGFWRHAEFGPQPCLTCIDHPGLVRHDCPSREGNEGANQ